MKRQTGFTLVELVIVIAVLGILAGLAIPYFMEAREEAAKKDAMIKSYETNSVKMRIAHENGIPFELASKLSGDDEESIKKDAETMAKFLKKKELYGRR